MPHTPSHPTPVPQRRLRRRSRWLAGSALLVACALGSATWLAAPSASAATNTPVVNAGSGRCLDVTGNSRTAGALVQIWDCNGGANQAWTTTAASELRVYGGA